MENKNQQKAWHKAGSIATYFLLDFIYDEHGSPSIYK